MRYESIDDVNKILVFSDLDGGGTITVVYSDNNVNGTLGYGVFGAEGLNAGVYVARLNDTGNVANSPLAVDQNVDGVFDGMDVGVVTKGGAQLGLGGGSYSVGGIWTAVDDYSGDWDDTFIEIVEDEILVEVYTPYEAFGYGSVLQRAVPSCYIVEGIDCSDFVITETKATLKLTNNLEYLSKPVVVNVEGCVANESNDDEGMNVGDSRVFNFENCDEQLNIGLKILKDVTLSDGDDVFEGNMTAEVYSMTMPQSCLDQAMFAYVKAVDTDKLKIKDFDGTCGFDLEQNNTGDYSYSMSDYGAFIELIGYGAGNELDIAYPLEQIKGLVSFVTGSGDEPPPPPPECEDNQDCENIYGSGWVCYNDYCCNQAGNCDGKECGSDSCGGTCPPGCDANETCDNGQCVAGGGPECETNDDCDVGEVCYNDYCCSPDCDGLECGSDSCGGSCGDCSGGKSCSSGTCVDDGGDYDTYYFDVDDDDYDEFYLDLYDVVVVQGLDDDYDLELNNIYDGGKVRFKVYEGNNYWKFSINGDIVNLDLDEDDEIDINVGSISVDTIDEEAKVRFEVGEYSTGSGGNGGSGSSGGYCGDGVCGVGESRFNCASDCGSVTTQEGSPRAGTDRESSYDAGGGYSGTTIVREGTPNTILWVILGMLIAGIFVLIILSAMKGKGGGQRAFVKEKPRSKKLKKVKIESEHQW